ncbi:MAG: transporter [Bradyrhizobium sp.]|nr:transporter [Bradyrhizobium sp.]
MLKGGWVWLLVVIVVAELAGSLETTLTFAALPAAMRTFARPEVSWLVTGYLLVAGASAALCGRLGDLFGRSQVLMGVLGLAALGSTVSALSNDLVWIIVGRSIQGFSGAILPLGYGLVREHFPSNRVPLGTGVITAAASLGATLGFVLGGLIVDTGHWHHVFFWSGVIAVLALALCWSSLPRSASIGSAKSLDILGGVLFAPTTAALLLAISMLQARGPSGVAFAILAAGILGLGIWVRYELRHPNPLIDVRLLRIPEVALANIAGASVALGAYQILLFFPLLLQQPVWTGIGFGVTATMTGLLKLPSNAAAVLGASSSGVVAGRIGGSAVMLIGFVMCVVGWGGLLFDVTHLWFVIAILCFSTAGATIVLAGMASVVMRAVPADRTSEATGVTIVVRMIFQALGALIVGALMASATIVAGGGKPVTYPAPGAFVATIIYIVLASAIGVLASLLLCYLEHRRGTAGSAGFGKAAATRAVGRSA